MYWQPLEIQRIQRMFLKQQQQQQQTIMSVFIAVKVTCVRRKIEYLSQGELAVCSLAVIIIDPFLGKTHCEKVG